MNFTFGILMLVFAIVLDAFGILCSIISLMGFVEIGEFLSFIPDVVGFIVFGICYAAFIMFSYFFLYEPPKDYTVPGYNPPVVKTADGSVVEEFNMDSKEMLKTPAFWMIFVSYMFGVGAGLMVIGIAKKWPVEVLTAQGIDPDTVNIVTQLAAALVYPFFNGLGRIIWGILAEKLSWRRALIIMNSVQTLFFILIIFLVKSPIGLIIGMAVMAFNYGGNFSLFPTATRNTFGSKYISQNYGWVFLSYGVGGILIPMMGAVFSGAGLQNVAFIIAAAISSSPLPVITITGVLIPLPLIC